jgi:hypothetical protein
LKFRAACLKNGSWTHKEDRDEFLRLFLHPDLSHWEWEGDEQGLIAMLEQQDQDKQQASERPAEQD